MLREFFMNLLLGNAPVIDLFSLRRAERFKVLHQLLPFRSCDEISILELGTGTGVLTEFLLNHYQNANVFTVEGAGKND